MGVFARLLRRSKTKKEEASTAEAQADQPSAASEADGTAEAKESGETDAGAGTEPAAVKEGDDGAPEAVEIPQQQSPGKAADSEADESART
ncbi:hypothetical protein K4749_29870 [Streptomyces sp. TRM72054]|uniref:hypothetical protein n=1 Tax=Streptomyces sp. TRM72054 TaxID=2870562 RepID=UPI001C8BF1D9|nr:hypothetical protein [Streptomyces sp. TRM72054]MBX9397684.1 hypothetical protein [Streptomyces sp. TRM72054]